MSERQEEIKVVMSIKVNGEVIQTIETMTAWSELDEMMQEVRKAVAVNSLAFSIDGNQL